MPSSRADAVTTEVIRHALRSAAGQMKRVLMRTAFSLIIYETLDFACGLYDRNVRLLAQAQTLPLFLGTLDACITAAVDGVGGPGMLEDGDILIYNIPYGTGAHPNDAAFVMPAFVDNELAGYAVVKAHFVDIGAKDVYATDTKDVHQEGTLFPGIKLYRAGERNDEVWRIILANSRAPVTVNGDMNAWIGGLRTGTRALTAIMDKHGVELFEDAIERIFDHGEAHVRRFVEAIPDGRYVSVCRIDDNGVTPDPITFDIAVEIRGSNVTVDLRDAPAQQPSPINSPLPTTSSVIRLALASLAGAGETPDEGQFRPLTIQTREGTIFHPVSPAPSFAYWMASLQLIEGFHQALAPAVKDRVPAESGGDIMVWVWWGWKRMEYQMRGHDPSEPWVDGAPLPVGQGGHAAGDGTNALIHISEAATRISPAEVWEAKQPWLVEKLELAADSCGAGRFRGGLGVDLHLRILRDCYFTSVVERTKSPPQGLDGGGEARPNSVLIEHPDGSLTHHNKTTAMFVEEGSIYRAHSGGGGGFGAASDRDSLAIAADLADGYVTPAYVRHWHPHYDVPSDDNPVADRHGGST